MKALIVSGAGQTMSPIELFWTAKNQNMRVLEARKTKLILVANTSDEI